ncbi:biotin/lipoyl-containing protein [uncultured Methanobrevibacter sp.]|uniref:biotin/lipoyl-containing protein n=1 Tax=uncultured Methanobrevibacter sp. TaxID=253161 RepID=UPI00262E19EE|nr:biotin/lipoyl-containing protein [uncultured Methanobrevibacter sp.]
MESYLGEGLIADIASWEDFFIVCDEESMDLALKFSADLDLLGVSSRLVDYGGSYESIFSDGGSVLAISKSGRDDFVIGAVKSARANGVTVYGLCGNFRSGLALLSDEVFTVKNREDFGQFCLRTFDEITEKLKDYYLQSDDNFDDSQIAYAPPGESPQFLGTVVDIKVKVGDRLEKGDVICTVDELKMEKEICIEVEGIVEEILIKPGDDIFTTEEIIRLRGPK